jgi:hypothetical protein
MFLAMTDVLSGEAFAPEYVTADLRGVTRDNERWAIRWNEAMFDALYSPDTALIVSLADWMGPTARAVPAPLPSPVAGSTAIRRAVRERALS